MFDTTMVRGSMVAVMWMWVSILILVGFVATQAHAQTLTALASFSSSSGYYADGLVQSGNTLYGWADSGGVYGYGTVFSLPVSGGTPTVLASFNGSNGEAPEGTLKLSGGTLYGTTVYGGAYGDGTVFSLPTSGGTPTVLASFNGTDGMSPRGSVAISGGTLYGTTWEGGATYSGTYSGANQGEGVVFALPVSGGTPTVLASLLYPEGCIPYAGLAVSGSTLYGTSSYGPTGYGDVFSLPTSGGTPTALASFSKPGLYASYSSLTICGTVLYGTTQRGGVNDRGTVFSLPVSGGTPTVLATFSGSNGENPSGTLAHQRQRFVWNGWRRHRVQWKPVLRERCRFQRSRERRHAHGTCRIQWHKWYGSRQQFDAKR